MDNRYTRISRDEANRLMVSLSEQAAHGGLSEDALSRAVWLYDDSAEYIPESVGTNWIIRNPLTFSDQIVYVEGFLRDHFSAPHCTELILLYPKVLSLIPGRRREAFIRDAYLKNGARNMGWIRAAMRTGISPKAISAMIKDRLAPLPAIEHGSTIHTPFHEFFDSAIVRVRPPMVNVAESFRQLPRAEQAASPAPERIWEFEPDTTWNVLTDEDFLAIARLCAEKAPKLTLQHRWDLAVKLPPQQVQEICVAAAERVPTLLHQNLEDLQLLPLDVRLRMARRITVPPCGNEAVVTGKFLVDLLLNMDLPEAIAFHEQIADTLHAINPTTLYRCTWKQRLQPKIGRTAEWLNGVLRDDLNFAGCFIGIIGEGQYRDRQGSVRRQWQVRDHGLTYVQDRHQHRYLPKRGDIVLYRPKAGKRLTPGVVAVMFIPATTEEEYA